jgi:hypothetical protein
VKTLPTVLNSNAAVQPEPKWVSFVLSSLFVFTQNLRLPAFRLHCHADYFPQLCKIMLMLICNDDCENAVPVFFGAAVLHACVDAFVDPVFVGS